MSKLFACAAVAALAACITPAYGQSCTSFPVPLTNGMKANAMDVMADFSYLGGSGCLAPVANPSFIGNLGIGTASPGAGLEVDNSGTNYTDGSFLLVNNSNASYGGGASMVGIKSAAAVGGNWFPLKIQGGGTTPLFFVTSTGAVYAGVSTIPYGNHGPFYSFNADPNTGMDWPGTNTLAFKTNNAEWMRITSAGNVGIGTTAPNYLLHVASSSSGIVAEWQNTGGSCTLTPPTATLSLARLTRASRRIS